jgi:hypothetical protein
MPGMSPRQLLRRRHSEILADLSSQTIVDLIVAWNGRPRVLNGVVPPRVPTAFAKQLTSVVTKMADELATLHTLIEASSKSSPAASIA